MYMKKKEKLPKKILVFCLVIIFGCESFAAVVSDNDGAAFIPKAEFDSMKNTFQKEIDRFNSTIDNKIESAISGYLSGVKNKKETYLDSMLNKINALAEDYYIDSGGNVVKYGYRTMARTYNTPTTQKPVGAKTAFFISRGDIDGSNRSGYARFGLTNGTRTGMGYVNIPNDGSYQHGKYLIYNQTSKGYNYPVNTIEDYEYLFYVGGAARTVTAGNVASNTTNPEASSFSIDSFKNQRTDWSIGSGNARFVWDQQHGGEAYSTIKCAYGTTFQKTETSSLVPICGVLDVNIIGLSNKNKTKMTLQEAEYVWPLFYTQTFWVNDGNVITNRAWFAGSNHPSFHADFTFCFNCHPYQNLNLKDFVDNYSTSVLGEKVLLTDGIPICKATSDGHIDITIEFMSRNTTHSFAACLRNEPFQNTYYGYNKSSSLHWRNINNEEYPQTNQNVALDTEYTWRVDAKKDDIIWLKVVDVSDQYGLVGAKTIEIKQVSNG